MPLVHAVAGAVPGIILRPAPGERRTRRCRPLWNV